MPDDLEMQARRLNEADRGLDKFLRVYRAEGYSETEILERVEEKLEEDREDGG